MTKKEQQLIAILSDHNLAAWDLSSHLCLWRVTTRPDVICKDLSSGLFAAFFGSKSKSFNFWCSKNQVLSLF